MGFKAMNDLPKSDSSKSDKKTVDWKVATVIVICEIGLGLVFLVFYFGWY